MTMATRAKPNSATLKRESRQTNYKNNNNLNERETNALYEKKDSVQRRSSSRLSLKLTDEQMVIREEPEETGFSTENKIIKQEDRMSVEEPRPSLKLKLNLKPLGPPVLKQPSQLEEMIQVVKEEKKPQNMPKKELVEKKKKKASPEVVIDENKRKMANRTRTARPRKHAQFFFNNGLLTPQTSMTSMVEEEKDAHREEEDPEVDDDGTNSGVYKRRVGRPTKAESMARLAASRGVLLEVLLARETAAAAAMNPPAPSYYQRKKERMEAERLQQQTLEQLIDVGGNPEAPMVNLFKRKRGRPSKAELRMRAMAATGGTSDTIPIALLRSMDRQKQNSTGMTSEQRIKSLVDSAWNAEVKALLTGTSMFPESNDVLNEGHLYPLVLLFAPRLPSSSDSDRNQDTAADKSGLDSFRVRFEGLKGRFAAISDKIDTSMGVGELAVLDQRLCLEEERFLLGKLHKAIAARNQAAAPSSFSNTVGADNVNNGITSSPVKNQPQQ